MSFFASVNGLRIVSGTLLVPAIGMWTADLHLATDQLIIGQAAVVIGDLTLKGFVYRTDVYGGQVRARLVGGYGGWRTRVSAQGYGSSTGIKLSTVLNDAARDAGEKISIADDVGIGNAFVRVNFATSVASDVLWQMLALGFIPAWRIDQAGVTQLTPWPTVKITTPFTVTDQKPDEGVVTIATEDYASWMPGAQFTSPLTAGTLTSAGVHYVWSGDGKFRFEVLTGAAPDDRVLGPIQQIIQKEIAPLRFFGRYEYTISNPSEKTIDGTPTDTELGLPDLQALPLCSDSIASYAPPGGGKAHVTFVNGQPTQPVCVWTEGQPTAAQLLGGHNPVARLGDQVTSFLPPTLVIVGVLSGAPFTGSIVIANPISGTITGGSAQVGSA